MKAVAVLGEGAWGTAIATLLAHNGCRVYLWCYDKHIAQAITATGYNERYLPGIPLGTNIIPVTALQQAVAEVTWIFEAIPVQFLRSVLEQLKYYVQPQQHMVLLSKGIEQETLLLPTQLVDTVFTPPLEKAVLAGPSFARDLATQQVTAVTLAASSCEVGQSLQQLLANNYFRPYLSLDLIGVQIGAAAKNVIALAIGMLDGAGYSDNAQSFVLTRGLAEMVILAKTLGGKPETIYGLSGVGDVVLTAMGKYSKNREVGKQLGQGKKLNVILQETGFIPEGVNTVYALQQLIQRYALDLPICSGVHAIITGTLTVQQFLTNLMQRPLEQDCVFSLI